jgi:hypothetical protein
MFPCGVSFLKAGAWSHALAANRIIHRDLTIQSGEIVPRARSTLHVEPNFHMSKHEPFSWINFDSLLIGRRWPSTSFLQPGVLTGLLQNLSRI